MRTSERYGTLAARVALAAIFLVSGFGKLAGPAGTAAYIASKGLPLPMLAAIGAGVLELAGGLMLLVGLRTRWAAIALAVFLVPVTALFHNPAGLAGMEAQLQVIQVLKNLAIIGGLLSVASWGAGALSLDARATIHITGGRHHVGTSA
jgi:putative oxidoreductase